MPKGRERRKIPSTMQDSSMVLNCLKYLVLGLMLTLVGLILLYVHKMHVILNDHVEIDGHAHEALTVNKISKDVTDSSSSSSGGVYGTSSSGGVDGTSSSGVNNGINSDSSPSTSIHFPKCTFNVAPKCQLDNNLKYWKEPPDCLR